jgi:deazaflavin-dependent oxidoreductase (nitroreductase family)
MTKQRRDVATGDVARMATDAAASLARRASGGLQRDVLNHLDKLAFRLGVPPAGDALLETIGRRTGDPRVTPVCDGLVGDTFWTIAQRGRRSGYVRNIEANPRVRVKVRSGWRTGTAHIVDDDDPRERQRILGRGNLARRLCLRASNAMFTSPLTVRIDLRPR